MQPKAQTVEEYISRQDDWKQQRLREFRDLVKDVQPDVVEEIKWNSPVFSVGSSMRVSMAAFKDHVKYNFFVKNREYTDPDALFNNGFDSVNFRSIDIKADDKIDAEKLRKLTAQFLQK